MPPRTGIEIESVLPGGLAEKAGLRHGDVITSLNRHPVHDVIDFMFYKSEELDIEFLRGGTRKKIRITADDGNDIGLTIKPFKVKTCRNNCIFCFVKQLPKGLRKALYVKDEDYRLSFLYGNYMTLSNMDAKDRKRIVEQRLSPLFVSVHTTNRALRGRMIGNPKAPDIMRELKFFAEEKIRVHTQIVLCPGYNDGKELQNTITDLHKFYPYVASIAVVPVGLTMHSRHPITPLSKDDALRAIRTVESFQKRFKKRHGDSIVYCADEMYIQAGHPFPPLKEYGVLPQIENGIGMVPLFVSQSKKVKVPKQPAQEGLFLTFTGTSFYPFLKKFTDRLSEKDVAGIDVVEVENNFFGPTVTVTGLLTGRDIIRSLHDITGSYTALLVPDVALKEEEDVFLDDVSLRDIEEATGVKTVRIESTPQGLVDAIADMNTETAGKIR
jgi:putative radical SAM enzyme (TIGR03279 family)